LASRHVAERTVGFAVRGERAFEQRLVFSIDFNCTQATSPTGTLKFYITEITDTIGKMAGVAVVEPALVATVAAVVVVFATRRRLGSSAPEGPA